MRDEGGEDREVAVGRASGLGAGVGCGLGRVVPPAIGEELGKKFLRGR